MEENNTPTVRAVVKYAEQLRIQADRQMVKDPYAKPYYPTTAYARKLSQQYGPAGAIDYLRNKSAVHEGNHREAEQVAQRALERHRRRKANALRDAEARAQGLTPGRRIDAALAELAAVSQVPAVRVGRSSAGADRDFAPKWAGDVAGDAYRKASVLAVELESALYEAKSRDLGKAA